jgi:predicted amidohydrolase YtcJ
MNADRTGRIDAGLAADLIDAGLAADLVVLDRDPFATPPELIHQARVAATFVDGRAVFRA